MEFYRFRSLKNLFNQYDDNNIAEKKIKRLGELEEQCIFFPTVQQLNDPMEGYRNLIWKGDKIVWINFIRNFMFLYTDILTELDTKIDIDTLDINKIKYNYTMKFREWNIPRCTKTGKLYSVSEINNITEEVFKSLEFIKQIDLFNEAFNPLLENKNFNTLINYLEENKIPNFKIEIILGVILLNLHNFIFDNNSRIFDDKTLLDIKNIINSNEPNFLKKDERYFSIKESSIGTKVYFKTIKLYLEILNESMFDNWYVTCFMKEMDNPIVWSHYADNHKSICFIYEMIEENNVNYLNLKNNKNEVIKFELSEVKYDENERKKINPFENFGMLMGIEVVNQWIKFNDQESKFLSSCYNDDFQSKYASTQINDLSIKSDHWKYENEYRIILSDIWKYYEKDEDRKFQYDYNQLKGIIIGINTDKENLIKIIEVVEKLQKKYGRKNDFTVKQSYYCTTNKKIKTYDIITL
ncbi:hypothetical protein B9T24_13980 [Acinetobacter sp. ANC 4654]|uniref:DUF2971 domain-containing protein n=1 Tax=Acinetobacter sp. ANC 4654 TaxID=1977872 RepID=UPI000A3526F0|nr:DUF2971 domain-containing protein [Acinetobacter sp. ANC 4654]OTG93576.1 hypothetical protein B9T24_13980 [Acinetobacter sp. ANC 4654]